jgi:acid phosphatase type 7
MFKGNSRPRSFSAGISPLQLGLASLFLALMLALLSTGISQAYDQFFLVKPYLQLGYEGKRESSGIEIVWFSGEAKHKWQVKYTTARFKSEKGREAQSITERLIMLPGFTAPYYKLTAHLDRLSPGERFDYKVLRDANEVFSSSAQMRKGPGQACHIALFGDCGVNMEGQRKLAKEVGAANPDLVVILGDIAYQQGLFSQYLDNFFPVYNLDAAKPPEGPDKKETTSFPADDGIDSMRKTLWAGVIGNHDISLSGLDGTNIDKFPDCLAYYIFWNEPLNGHKVGDPAANKNYPFLKGDLNRQELFKKSAGDAYPVMNNYSFDYGDLHFVALDGNYYMDWNDPKLRSWLAEDLKEAQGKAWRILLMHQPGFLVGAPHDNEQKMRLITDIAQKYNVNMVIAGHSHCFERSAPLTFNPPDKAKTFAFNKDKKGEIVDGVFTLDKSFDGQKNTRPRGIIYVVSGAGGARLYPIDPKTIAAPDCYMIKSDYSSHSFSSLDADDKKITFKQINEDGKVIDQFTITK